MGTLALRLTGATKRYPPRDGALPLSRAGGDGQAILPIFASVDLAVHTGEIFVLLGPSGCGKSTLLRVVAGLESLNEGRVEVACPSLDAAPGGQPALAPPRPRDVGIVFQEPLLYPWLSVAENVALGLRYRVNRHARATEPVEQILHDFGLAAVANAYPNELSGGQAQRASVARTVVTHPTLLLLDEPFSALDPRTRAALQDWLLDIVRRRNLTVLLVTHDVEEALYLGDHVALMSSCPGTIVRTWQLDPTGESPNGAAHAGTKGVAHDDRRLSRRTDERLLAIRREILSQYQTDVPSIPTAANSWVI